MPLSGMLPRSLMEYLSEFGTALQRAHEQGDPTWDAQLRARSALPLRSRLAQLFSIPPENLPVMMPPAVPFDSQFNTILPREREAAFEQWKQRNAPFDSGEDYDLRGAFDAGMLPSPKNGHWPDTFKKPNHPTFSDQSKYAPYGDPGHWDGNAYIRAGMFSR